MELRPPLGAPPAGGWPGGPGAGGAFCSGADLDTVGDHDFRAALYGMLHRLAEVPVPVVAAVHGPVPAWIIFDIPFILSEPLPSTNHRATPPSLPSSTVTVTPASRRPSPSSSGALGGAYPGLGPAHLGERLGRAEQILRQGS